MNVLTVNNFCNVPIKEALEITKEVKLQRPAKAKSYWRGVPHGVTTGLLLENLKARKFEALDATINFGQHGANMSLSIRCRQKHDPAQDWYPLIGVRVSNALHFTTTFYAGVQEEPERACYTPTVRICVKAFKTSKLVKSHSMEQTVKQMLLNWWEPCHFTTYHLRKGHINKLMEKQLSSAQGHAWMMRAAEAKCLPWKKMGHVANLNPRTFWGMLQAHSQVIEKHTAGTERLPRLLQFYNLMYGVMEIK